MAKDDKRIIDMTLEGDFVAPPPGSLPPVGARLMVWAVVATMVAISVLIVALTLWFLVMILPLILGAGLIAYIAFRYQLWRSGRSFSIRPRPGSDRYW
jgi:hypothetical protein